MVRDFYILAIGAIRGVLPEFPILLHDSFHGDMWASLLKYFPYDNIFMDTHIYHGFNPSDIGKSIDPPVSDVVHDLWLSVCLACLAAPNSE